MSRSDDRHAAKLARREESRRRYEAKQAARAERDRRLRQENERHATASKSIWAWWRKQGEPT